MTTKRTKKRSGFEVGPRTGPKPKAMTNPRRSADPAPAFEVGQGKRPKPKAIVDPHKKVKPPKKMTVTRGRRSPFVYEYK